MAFRGRQFLIHGSFLKREDAEKKHKEVPRSWVKRKKVKRLGIRYIVLTQKK